MDIFKKILKERFNITDTRNQDYKAPKDKPIIFHRSQLKDLPLNGIYNKPKKKYMKDFFNPIIFILFIIFCILLMLLIGHMSHV